MGRGMSVFMTLMILASFAIIMSRAEPNCNPFAQNFTPCKPFAIGNVDFPDVQCCGVLVGWDYQAHLSQQYKKDACQCFKKFAETLPIKWDKVKQLPYICELNTIKNIGPNVDCNA
ncbi:hypothetical protein LIER_35232 [Lithospermum erythrorhizon]|uniref:Bifunctional inhibitor/plant lipid transfer protein/seed storage helical domain-containing protein n=1 Tax=Lithospermum erythrorhizon TaxID=34254 RepID=A0AAV3NN73_LITER